MPSNRSIRFSHFKAPLLNIALFAATELLWLLLTGVPLPVALLATVLCGLSLSIPTAALGSATALKDAGSIWLHAGLAQIVVGAAAMTGRALHLSPVALPLTLIALGIVGSALRIPFDVRSSNPENDDVASINATVISWLGSIALFVFAGSAYFSYCFWMGRGPLPEYFYGVDNAFHLSLVHALVQSDLLPPPSLTYAGAVLPYQYGVLDAAATFVRLTGIAPHSALFLVIQPLMVMAIAAGCWMILMRIKPLALRICCFGLMFVATFEHWSIRWGTHLGSAIGEMVRNGLGATLPIDQNFHHTATLAGIVIGLYTIWSYCIDRQLSTRLLGAVVVGLMICVKSLFFITFGLWIGLIAVVEAGVECHRGKWQLAAVRRSLRQFIYPFVALAIAVTVQRVQQIDGGNLRIVFAFFADPYVNKNLGKLLQHVLILLIPLALAGILARGRVWSSNIGLALLLLVATYVFVSSTALVWAEDAETDFNWFQTASTTPLLVGVLVCYACWAGWAHIGSKLGRGLLIVAIIVACSTQLLRQTLMAVNTAANPELGWESLDNRELIAALQCIPLDHSITVTNDLRSPAENYKRPYRNTQLAAIMGQQFYFSVPAYDHAQANWADRMEQQHWLEGDHWSGDISTAAAKYGWTHFLVHSTFPHPADIPLQKACEIGAYTVYKF
ncbi:MAG TPA: hypothetical protein VN229_15960 [Terriglobales bacterium]|nr:hypothetical protein [Terriglobales bacterium]